MMKLEMVKELRDMNQGMKDSMNTMQESITQMSLGTLQAVTELKKFNK